MSSSRRLTFVRNKTLNRSIIQTVCFLAFVCASSASLGDIQAVISRPPQYWTGTSNGFSGVIFTETPGTYLTFASLEINGEVVKFYAHDPLSFPQTDWEGSVIFDSTHFPHGTPVTVRITAMNDIGETDSGLFAVTANVYNRAYILGNQTLPEYQTATFQASNHLGQMNHARTLATEHVKSSILIRILEYTVFYIWTHGHAGMFGDCFYINNGDGSHILTEAEVAAQVALKLDEPGYNFVFLDACSCANDQSLADAFGVTSFPNRLFLGWIGVAFSSPAYVQFSHMVWSKLEQGYSIDQAASAAQQAFGPSHWLVYGEGTMKLHSVWQGTPGQWYR